MNVNMSVFGWVEGCAVIVIARKKKKGTYHFFSGKLCVVPVVVGALKSSRLALHVGTVRLETQG